MDRLFGATIDSDQEVNRFRDAPRKDVVPAPDKQFPPGACATQKGQKVGCDDSPALSNAKKQQ
jgi:hypothetical protein